MNLEDWMTELGHEMNIPRQEAKKIMLFISGRILKGLTGGQTMRLRGVGDLVVKSSPARPNARNPKSGAKVSVPARKRVAFRPSLTLKRAMGSSCR